MKEITEEMKVHEEWYKTKPRTPEDLAAFVTKLLTEYHHDYGTICHAAAAAAVAACWTVNADENQGGITGFQAGAIMWQFIRHWQSVDGPMKLVKFDDMLYPQKEEQFDKTISLQLFGHLQEKARKMLAEGGTQFGPGDFIKAHPDVIDHWQRIADGEVPFGYRIKD